MSENLMNSAHKTSTDAYREGWDRIFGVSDASDMDIDDAMSQKYIEDGGNHCPFCGSDELEWIMCGSYWNQVECRDCGEKWHEVYELAFIERSPEWRRKLKNTT